MVSRRSVSFRESSPVSSVMRLDTKCTDHTYMTLTGHTLMPQIGHVFLVFTMRTSGSPEC